jgi:DNA-binding beta-propeller fold protein YncE
MRYFIVAVLLTVMSSCLAARADDVYVSCQGDKSMVRMTDGTLSTIATGFGFFFGLAVDRSGNLYLANRGDNTIIKFEMVNGTLSKTSTIFANGLQGPIDLAFDHEGNLYETDTADNIIKFTYTHGQLSNEPSVFADGSPEHANLKGDREPSFLAFDRDGNMYLSISIGGILKFSRTKSGLSNVPDAKPFATVSRARQMAFDKEGNLFTANHLAGDICVYKFPRLASGLSGTPEIFATGNGLDAPTGVAFDSKGNLYISNWGYGQGTTVLKYLNKNGGLSHIPVIFGPRFNCPAHIWCEKTLLPKATPKIHIPEKVQPQTPVPPPTPATRPDLFYD